MKSICLVFISVSPRALVIPVISGDGDGLMKQLLVEKLESVAHL